MKISLNWLSEYVNVPDLPKNLQGFCDKLDLTGTGVEDVAKLGEGFDNIVTGQILSKEKHPDSDHMWVTKVDVGSEKLQIVCGAQNFEEGDHVVVAKIGAVLPGDFKIKKAKLRGVESCGMNCSEEELGLADKSDGIMILPKDAPIGVPAAEYLGLSDIVIDTEITPNRPDCLSVVGCAREVAAIYDVAYKNPLKEMAAKLKKCEFEKAKMPSVKIAEAERCPRYTARVIKGVKVGPSPSWLVERLNAMGCRSINNIVDATNYILYLYGQPLHAFDYDKLKDKSGKVDIVVRAAKDGEKFTTLDDEKRTLTSDMTVISTKEKAVALAGVMGGQNSEVTDKTTSILLETATFSPAHTSRTSRNLGLISESSMRYERRVDDADIKAISDASVALIIELAGGKVCSASGTAKDSIVDEWPIKTKRNNLNFRVGRFQKMMGAPIKPAFIKKTLANLGCDVAGSDKGLKVKTPTFRPDLEREIDLYEEVLRIFGMDRVKSTLPKSEKRVGARTPAQRMRTHINNVLSATGLNETICYAFADAGDGKLMGLNAPVELINPMNADQKQMRQSLIPGLLRSVSYNVNRGVADVALYETGVVFSARKGQELPRERERVAGVMSGTPINNSWNNKAQAYDFFDAKGVVENLCKSLNIKKLKFAPVAKDQKTSGETPAFKQHMTSSETPAKQDFLQPGRAAEVTSKGTLLGWVGEVHPKLAQAFEIESPVAAFELDMKALMSMSNAIEGCEEISQFPSVCMDVAFTVNKDITNEVMLQRITSAGGNMLKSVRLFDVFESEKHLGKGKKSLAYSLEYADNQKTLTSEEVEKVHSRLIDKVIKSTGAKLR